MDIKLKEALLEDLRALALDNPNVSISRGYYRQFGAFSESDYEKVFGTWTSFKREAGLEESREERTVKLAIARQNNLDHYRKYYREEVIPNVGKYEKIGNDKDVKTLVIGADAHGNKKCDPFALSVFIDVCHRLQPDVIVLLGDWIDNYSLSRFDVDPRLIDIAGEFKWLREEVFKPLRELCPNSQIDYILGNHEKRVLTYISQRSPLVSTLLGDVLELKLSDLFGVDKYQVNWVCKWDFAAYQDKDVKEQIAQNYKVYYNAFVASHIKHNFGLPSCTGHLHTPLTTVERLVPGITSFTQVGSLAKGNDSYVEVMSKNVQGMAIVHIHVPTREVIPENIVFNDSYCAVAGRYYWRNN